MVSRFVAYPAADPEYALGERDGRTREWRPDRREERVVRERRPLTGDRQLLGRRDERRRGRYRRAGDGSRSTTRQRHDHAPERVWLRPTWPARPHSSRRRASTTQPSAFERPLDRSRTSRRRSRDTASIDIQAALQNDQPEDEPADVLTDDAELRDDIFRGEAAARGSWLATFL